MFVDGHGAALNDDDAKRSCVACQELVICARGELMCILIFDCNQWRPTKVYILIRFVSWRFALMAVTILFECV